MLKTMACTECTKSFQVLPKNNKTKQCCLECKNTSFLKKQRICKKHGVLQKDDITIKISRSGFIKKECKPCASEYMVIWGERKALSRPCRGCGKQRVFKKYYCSKDCNIQHALTLPYTCKNHGPCTTEQTYIRMRANERVVKFCKRCEQIRNQRHYAKKLATAPTAST